MTGFLSPRSLRGVEVAQCLRDLEYIHEGSLSMHFVLILSLPLLCMPGVLWCGGCDVV
jgi:hypothetical protein